jgi:hypothetical protein
MCISNIWFVHLLPSTPPIISSMSFADNHIQQADIHRTRDASLTVVFKSTSPPREQKEEKGKKGAARARQYLIPTSFWFFRIV